MAIKLLFVPLNWADTQEEFNSLVRTQSQFFTNAIPLSACPERISMIVVSLIMVFAAVETKMHWVGDV
jgi:hypothetical protein